MLSISKVKHEKVPVECFLHRIFPIEFYSDKYKEIIDNRAFKPRRDSETQFLKRPIDWEAKEHSPDRNHRMQLQGWSMFHPIMNFFDEYPNKDEILEYFFDILEDWSLQYENDPDDVVTTRMPQSYAWYDMSVGFRALILAFFLNRIETLGLDISSVNIDRLEKIALKHIKNLSNEDTFSLNNHGMFQIQGLMGLIQHYGIDKYEQEHLYALDKMEALVLSQFDVRGIHLEHSPHYHFYSLSTFEAVVKSGWYNAKPSISHTIQQAIKIKKWIVDPYKRPACIGDSILTVQKNINFTADTDNDPAVEYIQSDFNESGYAVIRSNWHQKPEQSTYLFFMGAYHAKTHKHRDCLSFEWFDNGEKIICDSGKYGYKSDKYRHYFLSNRAHNTVEIEGFDILKIKPYYSAIKKTEALDSNTFLINAALEYPAISFDRSLYVRAGKWVIIKDTLSFKKKRKATQWHHLNKTYNHLVHFDKNRLSFQDRKSKKQLIIHCLNEDAKPVIHNGNEDNMQGFISEKDYEFSSAFAVGFDFYTSQEDIITILALKPEYEQEALQYVHNQLATKTAFSIEDIVKNKPPLIKDTPHNISVGLENLKIEAHKNTYCVIENNWEMNFYADIKKSNKLLIFLPGATDRSKKLINLQRSSWSDAFDQSIISFADPTICEANEISIGWFQGKKNVYALDKLAGTLKKIIDTLKIKEKNITIFGSSAGGFVTLQLANIFPKATTISINPQIYLHKYIPLHFDRVLDFTYSNLTLPDVLTQYPDRINLNIDFSKREAPCILYQNISDTHHMNEHLTPYLKTLDPSHYKEANINDANIKPNKGIQIIYYEDTVLKHSPPDKDTTIAYIKAMAS